MSLIPVSWTLPRFMQVPSQPLPWLRRVPAARPAGLTLMTGDVIFMVPAQETYAATSEGTRNMQSKVTVATLELEVFVIGLCTQSSRHDGSRRLTATIGQDIRLPRSPMTADLIYPTNLRPNRTVQ
jgi:hypothetical protein